MIEKFLLNSIPTTFFLTTKHNNSPFISIHSHQFTKQDIGTIRSLPFHSILFFNFITFHSAKHNTAYLRQITNCLLIERFSSSGHRQRLSHRKSNLSQARIEVEKSRFRLELGKWSHPSRAGAGNFDENAWVEGDRSFSKKCR